MQELLQLNQLDTAAAPPPASRANLADILERTLAPLQPQIEDKNLEIARDLPDVEIEAPLSHLEMLLRNLVENAVKYAPQNGQISVKLEACGSQALLQLENDAQIAPDEDVNAWFEPFFRPDAARTAANGGNGLGLAICRAIADCNGWKLELSAPKRRVRVRVEWQKLAPSRG